jgi:sugar/nucleoside kinase (ribokinase family)
MSEKIVVTGIGCCLVDLLYSNIDFEGKAILPYLSEKRGDGGLSPGKLVFKEEFEEFCGISFKNALNSITGGKTYNSINIGGPSIVALMTAAQLAGKDCCEVRFYGRGGDDEMGRSILTSLGKTPVLLGDYKLVSNETPFTLVLSDPSFDNGHGERMFINSIGAAGDYLPDEVADHFFDSDIAIFGGTALVPQIHDGLTTLLKKAKSKNCITIVNTVFDFRNEKANPDNKWPLGESDHTYKYIDILIADREEALRLSGQQDMKEAIEFFRKNRLSSLIITNGSKNISVYSDGSFFAPCELTEMPVSKKVTDEIKTGHIGDTTGCGDNFVGGVLASVITQLHDGIKAPDIGEACCWGIVSGGYTCFYMGGAFFEKNIGEQLAKIKPYYESYKKQISD